MSYVVTPNDGGEPFEVDDFVREYMATALWSSTDESTPSGGEPLDQNYDLDDVTRDAWKSAIEDCRNFRDYAKDDLALAAREYGLTDESAGYDFWLSRNRHGAGFWDRGMGEVGERLHEAAKTFGTASLYVGDDGRIYGGG